MRMTEPRAPGCSARGRPCASREMYLCHAGLFVSSTTAPPSALRVDTRPPYTGSGCPCPPQGPADAEAGRRSRGQRRRTERLGAQRRVPKSVGTASAPGKRQSCEPQPSVNRADQLGTRASMRARADDAAGLQLRDGQSLLVRNRYLLTKRIKIAGERLQLRPGERRAVPEQHRVEIERRHRMDPREDVGRPPGTEHERHGSNRWRIHGEYNPL